MRAGPGGQVRHPMLDPGSPRLPFGRPGQSLPRRGSEVRRAVRPRRVAGPPGEGRGLPRRFPEQDLLRAESPDPAASRGPRADCRLRLLPGRFPGPAFRRHRASSRFRGCVRSSHGPAGLAGIPRNKRPGCGPVSGTSWSWRRSWRGDASSSRWDTTTSGWGGGHAIDFALRVMKLSPYHMKPLQGIWSKDALKLVITPSESRNGHTTYDRAHHDARSLDSAHRRGLRARGGVVRIRVINPFGGTEFRGRENLARIKRSGTEFDMVNIADAYPLKKQPVPVLPAQVHRCDAGTGDSGLRRTAATPPSFPATWTSDSTKPVLWWTSRLRPRWSRRR